MRLLEWAKNPSTELSFDSLVMFVYNSTGGKFIKLFDKNLKTNDIMKLRNIVIKLSTSEENLNDNIDLTSNLAAEEVESNHNIPSHLTATVKSAVRSFMKSGSMLNPAQEITTKKDTEHIIKRALVYNATGSDMKSKQIVKKLDQLPPEKQQKVLNRYASHVLVKDKSVSVATHNLVKAADPAALTDYEWPKHIFQKRYNDFSQNLRSDINDAFSTLNKKDIPLRVEKIKVNKVETGPSEILKTIKDRYFITLKDKNDEDHEVHIDIPHLTKNGTFMVNGQEKVLVNQLIRFPIFFPAVNVGRFQSSFSVLKINSKALRQGAYFILFMGSYKTPLIMYLAYRYGLKPALEEYGVKYRIEKIKGGSTV